MLILAAIISLHVSSETTAGGGSAGVRGGGTGIICTGQTQPILIEEWEIEQHLMGKILPRDKRSSVFIPDSRAEVESWVLSKIGHDKKFIAEFKQVYSEVGEYKDWPLQKSPRLQGTDSFFSEFRRFLQQSSRSEIFSDFSKTLARSQIENEMSDDFFHFPKGCRKIQLSAILEGRPHRIFDGSLTARTIRYLELHETFYLMGMRNNGHSLPFLSRELIKSLAMGSVRNAHKSVKRFTQKRNPIEFRQRDGLMVLSGWGTNSDETHLSVHCPFAMTFLFDGEEQRVVALFANKDGTVHTEKLKSTSLRRHSDYWLSLDFVLEPKTTPITLTQLNDQPLVKNRINWLELIDQDVYLLRFRSTPSKRSLRTSAYPFVYPKKLVLDAMSSDSSFSCQYREWREQGFTANEFPKIWNEIFVGQ
ncbi:MAG: hypothetical protein EOP04_10270 [Proteobacteria bacterium]|nr:MAG: hypothetical protein EOP04_10270 [Pseudomonadota bacterium]